MRPTVLFYHQVLRRPRPDHYFFRQSLTLERFREAMEFVRRHYHPISVEQMWRLCQDGEKFPPKSVLITFDDGFRNNLLAAEILHGLGMSALFFVLTATIDTDFKPWYLRFASILSTRRKACCGAAWGDVNFDDTLARRRWLAAAKEHLLASTPVERDRQLVELATELQCPPIDPADEDYDFLGADDLRRMLKLGMTIGGHSATHDNLARCDDAELQREMVESTERLAAKSGGPIDYFSYPDGRYDSRVLDIARRQFRMAFAASCHLPKADLWRYPRRAADDCTVVSSVLSRWYPLRRRAAEAAKRLLGKLVRRSHPNQASLTESNTTDMSLSRDPSLGKGRGAAAFWGCGGMKVAVLLWMGCHALPVSSWDEVVFLQPAYMHVHTGQYSIPTFAGTMPHANLIAASYCTLYELIYGGLFQVLGFSRWTSMAIHMTVHLLVSGLFAGVVWRVTKSGWLGGLYWLAATYLLGQFGRPEEFGILFGALAVVVVSSRRLRLLAASELLGASGAIAPVGAVVATVISVCRLWLELGFGRSFVKLSAVMASLAVAVTVGVACWYVHPYYREALQQFQASEAYVYRAPLDLLLLDFNPFGLSSLLIFGLISCGLTLRLFCERRKVHSFGPAWLNTVGVMLLVAFGGIGLARWMGRPSYDYRWLGYLWSAIAVVVASEMGRTIWLGRRWKFRAAIGCLIVAFMLANRDTFRYCVAPLLFRPDSITYPEAVAAVNRIVPKTATVGGDPNLWMAVTDGRPYIAVKWIGKKNWPDYLISSSLGRDELPILEKPSWATKIRDEYEEIPPSWPPAPPNHLTIGPLTIPVFHSDADWRFHVWKRRPLPNNRPEKAGGVGN